jgi:hypothetical protein
MRANLLLRAKDGLMNPAGLCARGRGARHLLLLIAPHKCLNPGQMPAKPAPAMRKTQDLHGEF